MEIKDLLCCFAFDNQDYYLGLVCNGEDACKNGFIFNSGSNCIISMNGLINKNSDFIKNWFYNLLKNHDSSEDLIIIAVPKNERNNLISSYKYFYKGQYFDNIIESQFILGYFDKENTNFYFNNNYEFKELYPDLCFSKQY